MASEQDLKLHLEELRNQLGKKQRFEEAIYNLKSVLKKSYPSASISIRAMIYSCVCRAAVVLKTRYTTPNFWVAGLGLFELALSLVVDSAEKEYLKKCIDQAKEHLHDAETSEVLESAQNQANRGYLFEGHLTVDPEPPLPNWLAADNLLTTLADSSQGLAGINNDTIEFQSALIQQVIDSLDIINPGVEVRRPPASREVVDKLPIITITEEILAKLGKDAECAVCRENLKLDDKMQELPCKHMFHPPCLKPWLDKNNSCPICRHELRTDDHVYESRKEQEKEAEEERKGAENALRGGEFMYV